MGKRRPRGDEEDNGFAQWGGYMNAKKAKLVDQYNEDAAKNHLQTSNIFKGVAIMVNGWTKPSADELKQLMAEHGGLFHIYQMNGFTGATTHVIASNLPNFKIKNMGSLPIVKPDWITDSIKQGRRLNYKKYLLYTNQSRTQPKLNFLVQNQPSTSKAVEAPILNEQESDNQSDIRCQELSSNPESDVKSFSKRTKSQSDLKSSESSFNKLLKQRIKSDGQASMSKSEDLFMKINFDDFVKENSNYLEQKSPIKLLTNPIFNKTNNSTIQQLTKALTNETNNSSSIHQAELTGNSSDVDLFEDFDDGDFFNKDVLTESKESSCRNMNLASSEPSTSLNNDKLLNSNKNAFNTELQQATHASIVENTGVKTVFDPTFLSEVQQSSSDINKSFNVKDNKNASVVKNTDVKTASDPTFLSEFYNNSRLHLIATLGAEFKQLVCTMREKSNGVFPGRDELKKLNKEKLEENNLLEQQTVIMHIDMDCFFVSVGLRNHPELRGKPVAVAHARGNPTRSNPERQAEFALYAQRLPEGAMSRVEKLDDTSSMSELASCSYEARKCGIKNGMFLGAALKLCPELQTIPYDFNGYKEVSKTLYETIAEYTLNIEAVSCDEMYVDISKILQECNLTVYEWAEHIRTKISDRTGCPCSTGFGSNRLQARLATKKAKPAGQYYLYPVYVESYFYTIPLADLPGVGRTTLFKLENIGLKTCGDVQSTSLQQLQKEIGTKLGETIFEQSKGIDKKPLNYEHERKSVSAEVNYGIRFKNSAEALDFLEKLSEEVYSRLSEVKMQARSVTLKVMIRAANAPLETAKFLGHGVCDSLSRCTTTNYMISDAKVIFKEVKMLYDKLNLQPTELRGVGIQLGRLEKAKKETTSLANFLKGHTVIVKKANSSDNYSNRIDLNARNINENIQSNNKTVGKMSSSECFTNSKFNTNTENLASCSKDNQCHEEVVISNVININNNQNLSTVESLLITNSLNSKVILENTEKTAKKTISDNLNKSKRGRPKGSTNTKKTTINRSQSISNFFKSGKIDTTRNHFPHDDNSGYINFDVLEELPEELRQEILSNIEEQNRLLGAYKSGKGTNSAKNNKKKLSTTKIVEENAPQPSTNDKEPVCNENTIKENKKSTFSDLNKDELKLLIKNWVLTEKPLDCDIEMLGLHLKSLAIGRKIEDLEVLVKFLHRVLNKLNNCYWHSTYFTIVNLVQEGMLTRYGHKLFIPTAFNCKTCK